MWDGPVLVGSWAKNTVQHFKKVWVEIDELRVIANWGSLFGIFAIFGVPEAKIEQ